MIMLNKSEKKLRTLFCPLNSAECLKSCSATTTEEPEATTEELTDLTTIESTASPVSSHYRRDPLICGPLICGFWPNPKTFSKIVKISTYSIVNLFFLF
jgi:hypothetical protein